MSLSAPISACPACAAVPAAEALAARTPAQADVILSLPGVHCAACISTVERALLATPGVHSARVNLTLKRVMIDSDAALSAEALIARLASVGYDAYELDAAAIDAGGTDARGRALLMRLAVAGFAMMNVMLLSVAVWSGAADATRVMFHWISAMIALPAIGFAAQPFFASAFSALRVGRLNMDVPISLAILLASAMSVYETMAAGQHAYFDAALSLTFFLLAGRYLDHRTRAIARSAAQELTALEVPRARRIDGSDVPVADLRPGDLIRVVPGARVPVDGVVTEGASDIDRSRLTGESLPVRAGIGADLCAGEVNLSGPLVLRVTAAGRDTSLRRLADLVALAETNRNRYTSLADRAAAIYAPAVHLLALAAFLGWYAWGGDLRLALNIAVAVLIITCPCALGLAVPAVVTAASGRLFRAGLLIKSATALERLAEVDTVVFDKTGTLTDARPTLVSEHDDAVLSLALAMAQGSAHPLSEALAVAARDRGLTPARMQDLREHPGQGVSGRDAAGQVVRLGRADWLCAEPTTGLAACLQRDDAAPVTFRFAESLRDGAEQAVAAIKARGLAVSLLSGDGPVAVAALAGRLGIEDWHAGVLPEDKARMLQDLGDAGHRVLMVGDGLNDTAAMAAAHVSISPASALEATRVVSDIVLLGQSLAPLGEAISVARTATRRIKQNFAIAAGYNMIAVPIALAGFATPLAAALAMSSSSIIVSLNALRLRGRS